LLIPGERFNKTIVEYLQFAREFNRRFPGFDTDIHGLVEEDSAQGRRYFVDCVQPSNSALPPPTHTATAASRPASVRK
jgi:arginine/lysine/ornithine decarboxylase